MRIFGSSRRFGVKLMMMLAGAMVWAGALAPARAAIEVRCIEASQYKYLYRIFDNNPAKVAAYMTAPRASSSRRRWAPSHTLRAMRPAGRRGPRDQPRGR